MKTFHHGGRLGDCLYALYTVKALGGGDLYMSLYQQGNWDHTYIAALIPLLEYQPYIRNAHMFTQPDQYSIDQWAEDNIDYDLHKAELDYNPDAFPEWDEKHWPGNCHIAKRYAVHFNIGWNPEAIWLKAPHRCLVDVAMHAPKRRLASDGSRLAEIVRQVQRSGHRIVVLGGPHDYSEWQDELPNATFVAPKDMLEFADWINSAKVFVGTASSGNVIAEGLKKPRFVELAEDCHNVYAEGKTGRQLNDLPVQAAVRQIRMLL